jgi:hypothetical protein
MAEKLVTSMGPIAVDKKEATMAQNYLFNSSDEEARLFAKKPMFAIKYNCHRIERSH